MGEHHLASVLAHDQDVLLHLEDAENVRRLAERSRRPGRPGAAQQSDHRR